TTCLTSTSLGGLWVWLFSTGTTSMEASPCPSTSSSWGSPSSYVTLRLWTQSCTRASSGY
ncbi:hypothetical protein M9458_005786, partial [Cirrhinus mrigala]